MLEAVKDEKGNRGRKEDGKEGRRERHSSGLRTFHLTGGVPVQGQWKGGGSRAHEGREGVPGMSLLDLEHSPSFPDPHLFSCRS